MAYQNLALEMGYPKINAWNRPQNSPLKKTRTTSNVLLRNFARPGATSILRLCIQQAGEPCRRFPYLLVVDGKLFNGSTDDQGWIDVDIPANARKGQLTIGDDPWHQQVVPLEFTAFVASHKAA